MTKRIFNLVSRDVRQRAADYILREAPDGSVLKIGPASRSLDQNSKLWPMLTDVSRQVPWYVDGELVFLCEEDWKDLFTAALKKHTRMAKGLDGGVVMLGARTSRMPKAEFSDLIELVYAFGAERGVQWSEPVPRAEREAVTA